MDGVTCTGVLVSCGAAEDGVVDGFGSSLGMVGVVGVAVGGLAVAFVLVVRAIIINFEAVYREGETELLKERKIKSRLYIRNRMKLSCFWEVIYVGSNDCSLPVTIWQKQDLTCTLGVRTFPIPNRLKKGGLIAFYVDLFAIPHYNMSSGSKKQRTSANVPHYSDDRNEIHLKRLIEKRATDILYVSDQLVSIGECLLPIPMFGPRSAGISLCLINNGDLS